MSQVMRGQVYQVKIDDNLVCGHEMKKSRPAVIVSSELNNQYSTVYEVAFLTSKRKRTMPTQVLITSVKGLRCASVAMCEHINSVDSSRLDTYYGKVSEEEMRQIDRALLISFFGEIECGLNGDNVNRKGEIAYGSVGKGRTGNS